MVIKEHDIAVMSIGVLLRLSKTFINIKLIKMFIHDYYKVKSNERTKNGVQLNSNIIIILINQRSLTRSRQFTNWMCLHGNNAFWNR